MAASASPTVARTATSSTDDDIQLGEDTSETTKLFHERLQAWKHACGYIEEYVKSTEKMQHAHGKEYEKVLKTINQPLKEGEHFDHNSGGIAGMFDSMRQNTQAISNSHSQTAQTLKGSVLPIFERLHAEIKNKQKELAKGVGKGNKAVDKARADTQKHVERLGTHSASYQSHTAKDAENDPYVLQRGINHRLGKQFQEENSSRQDLLSVQNSFSQFESHVVQTIQQGLGQFNSTVGGQADQQKQLYSITTQTAQAVDPTHEWNLFMRRNNSVLIDANAPPRTVANATFPHQNDQSTKPMCQGILERKSGIMRKFEGSLYAVTPSRFFHEFKSDDDVAKDPTPELSLFLPDCSMGALNGNLFSLKGKDVSKGKLGAAMSPSKEYEFRASTGKDAETWYNVIVLMVGKKPGEPMTPTSASSVQSPTGSLASRDKEKQTMSPVSPTSAQETGVTQGTGATSTQTAQAEPAGAPPTIAAPVASGSAGQDLAAPSSTTSTTSPTGAQGAGTGTMADNTGMTKSG